MGDRHDLHAPGIELGRAELVVLDMRLGGREDEAARPARGRHGHGELAAVPVPTKNTSTCRSNTSENVSPTALVSGSSP